MGVGAVYDRTFLEAVGCALTERTYTHPARAAMWSCTVWPRLSRL